MQQQNEYALTPYEPQQSTGMVLPVASPEQAKQAIAAYEALKSAIVRDGDVQYIQGGKFLKKSFWRRAARAFGLSVEPIKEDYFVEDDGSYGYSVIYRATAPNGQSMAGDGLCMSNEKRNKRGDVILKSRHDVRATAHTRAANRAISNLIGGGEVSAEEISSDEDGVDANTGAGSNSRTSGKANSLSDLKRQADTLGITGAEWGKLYTAHKADLGRLQAELARIAQSRQAKTVQPAQPTQSPRLTLERLRLAAKERGVETMEQWEDVISEATGKNGGTLSQNELQAVADYIDRLGANVVDGSIAAADDLPDEFDLADAYPNGERP